MINRTLVDKPSTIKILGKREGVRGEVVPGKGVGYLADGRSSLGPQFARLASNTVVWACPMKTGFSVREFTMEPAPGEASHAFCARCRDGHHRSPERIAQGYA